MATENAKREEFINRNPATGEEIGRHPVFTSADVDALLERAEKAWINWAALRPEERAKYLRRFRKQIVHDMDEIVDVICAETGKTKMDGVFEIFTVAEHMKYIEKYGPSFLRDEPRRTGLFKNKKAWVTYQPRGVVGIISPWNYPFILTAGPIAQALMAGNTVVVKPSEVTPATTLKMREIADRAGLPADVFLVATGDGRTGQALVESARTKMICFTGSTATGRKIAEICGRMLKPVILELGGKDPMIVLDDAPLERAAHAALWGGMSNSGQTCISVERILVHEKVKDRFIELLEKNIKNLKQGLQSDHPSVGSMAFEKQLGIVLDHINEAKSRGARIVAGGNRNQRYPNGLFIEPTIVVVNDSNLKVWKEETFGPVIALRTFSTEAEAIDMANDSVYGLNASVWSKNKSRARKIARQIRSGCICINDVMTNYIISDLPFGGQKESGLGRVYGPEGLRAFTDLQSVMEDRFTMTRELWWFPYSEKIENLFRKATRLLFG